MTKVVARLESVLALASQRHGGVTFSEKLWSLFSIKIPAVHTKIYRTRRKWNDDNESKQPLLDKSAAILAEGSIEGEANNVVLVDPTKAAAEGINDNINRSVKMEEPIMTAEEGSSDFIKEGAVINKLTTTAVEYNDAAKILKSQPVSMGIGTQNLKVFTFDELRRATRNFRPSAMLGFSDGASVYKGWVDRASLTPSAFGIGIAVAIKISNTNDARSHQAWQVYLSIIPSNFASCDDDEAQLYFGWASLAQVRDSFSIGRYNPPEYMSTGQLPCKAN
ncbi:hypothetical protein L1887_16240 [Cichorium endivia]|nr:hypothetical protein L1887_16240 [Cichorium endivia]